MAKGVSLGWDKYFAMKDDEKTVDQIAEEAAQDLKDAIKKYVAAFKEKTSDSANFLSISDLENLMGELDGETRKIYLNMLSDSLSNVDEKGLISSKKENFGNRG